MEEKDFGVTLEKLLKKHNMNISQLARSVGVSPTTAQEWVGAKGRFPSKPRILQKIAQTFGLTLHELLFGEPDPMSLVGQILEKTDIHTGLYEISIKRIRAKEAKK